MVGRRGRVVGVEGQGGPHRQEKTEHRFHDCFSLLLFRVDTGVTRGNGGGFYTFIRRKKRKNVANQQSPTPVQIWKNGERGKGGADG